MRSARPGRRSRAPPIPRPRGSSLARLKVPQPRPGAAPAAQPRARCGERPQPAAARLSAVPRGSPRCQRGPSARCRSPPGPRPWQPWPGELPACEGPGVSGRDPRPGRFACCRGGRARDAGLGQGQSSRCALRAGKFCLFQNNGLAGGSWFFFCSFRAFRCLRSRLSCGGLCCSSSTSGNAVMK